MRWSLARRCLALKIINALVIVAVENLCSAVLMAEDRPLATAVLVKADRHLVDLEALVQRDFAPEVVDPADQKVVDQAVLVVVPSAQWPVGRVRDQR